MVQQKSNGYFEPKFDLWKKKLLDLSMRNRLLNYKPLKTGTYQLEGEMEELFDKLVHAFGFIFDSVPYSEASDEEAQEVRSRARKLEFIRKQIKSAEDEMGFNIGYAAFGFLKWADKNAFDKEIQSPLILVPITINRESLTSPYVIEHKVDDEIELNPVLLKKLEDDYGIKIDVPKDFSDFAAVLSDLEKKLSSFGWSLEPAVMIDTFNFQNLVILKDLEMNKEKIHANPFIKALVEENDASVEQLFDSYNQAIDLKHEKSQARLQILDADSSQQEAISRARRGDSFVLQGPPGTGKSQTISNIIAEQLGLGKRILFVSEKQAALDVVYQKLRQNGLEKFVLTLHNTKQKKGDIRNQLKESLDLAEETYRFVDDKFSLYTNLDQVTQSLNDYDELVHRQDLKLGKSFYDLHGKLAKVQKYPHLRFQVDQTMLEMSFSQIEDLYRKIQQLASTYLSDTQHHHENSWRYYNGELSLSQISDLKALLLSLKEKLQIILNNQVKIQSYLSNSFSDDEILERLEKMESLLDQKEDGLSEEWIDLGLDQVLEDLKTLREKHTSIQNFKDQIEDERSQVRGLFEDSVFETESLGQVLKFFKYEYNSFLKRLFSSEYKEHFNAYRKQTKTLKLTYDQLVEHLEILENIHENEKDLQAEIIEKGNVEKKLSKTIDRKLDGSVQQVDTLLSLFSWLQEFQEVVRTEEWLVPLNIVKELISGQVEIDWDSLRQVVTTDLAIKSEFNQLLEEFRQSFPTVSTEPDLLSSFLDSLDFEKRDEYFTYKRAKDGLLEEYDLNDFIQRLEEKSISAEDVLSVFKKRFLFLLLESKDAYSKISQISKKELENQLSRFRNDDKQTFSLARDRIFKSLVDRLPSINENIVVTGGEISILKKELKKKSRLLSTRRLIQELPNLLPRLKPCIMMSPLTVSTYFATNTDWEFDLVIFDEASQVKTEYAVAAISRGKQIIVAGDSKQMPPTSFFDSSRTVEELAEDEVDIEDLESILDELSVKIPETYLNWHYRSKDESLITFSNHKFYNNRLYTFPSENSDIHSNVTFNYVPTGIWESRAGNDIEAEKVAEMVMEHAIKHPDQSLGVVAFGMSQARAIEDKILVLREQNPELETFFDENKTEAFFVKNLENVQGDERDVILLSVGYAKGPTGKLRMNFGPLTKTGGERRLNVAVSRARENMHVISSIRSKDITTEGSSNENRFLFRDFLEFAEKGVGALIGYDLSEQDQKPQFDSDFEEAVYDYLVTQGYQIHTQVGASGYRIDMAVIHPTIPGRYVLAIECDGAAYHSSKTARDRDRLRQEILESKGWNFYRIWSTTWIHDTVNEKQHLKSAIDQAIKNYLPDAERTSRPVLSTDTLTTNLIAVSTESVEYDALPFYFGDVYDFENAIPDLADIIMKIAPKYVGYKTEDLMRHINKNVFDKQRLTQGYKAVYEAAFEYLVETERMELAGDLIQTVQENP